MFILALGRGGSFAHHMCGARFLLICLYAQHKRLRFGYGNLLPFPDFSL